MYGGVFKMNPTPVKGSIRTWQLPRAQDGMIMAPKGTSSSTAPTLSNVESFLEAVTPSIPATHLPKSRKKNMGTYFVLNELWESFDERSAYGVGARMVLSDGQPVVQYYVPYLSAIQIYTHQKPSPKSRLGIKNSEGECSSKGSNSDVSNSEREKISTNINSQSLHNQTTNISLMLGKISLREQKVSPQEGNFADEGESSNARGNLLFEHFEYEPPFARQPLYEKISELASRFPELKSMRSCDLHPSSWFSVAWYPIYRIPVGPTLKNLDACFLTYHSLYTPTKASTATSGVPAPRVYRDEKSGSPKIALPSFGLSTYKFKPLIWTGNNERSNVLVNSLSNGAKNWVKFLNVYHPDHAFFVTRR